MVKPIFKICLFCNKTFNARRGREITRAKKRIYCSRGCVARHRATFINGANHHAWKHGLRIDKKRYISKRTYLGPHRKHSIKGMHRIVVEQFLGRLLDPLEEVHHINGDKHDNSIINLKVLSKEEHARLHGIQRGRINGLATI